jgi:2,4-dienoyl-CoA reductase-like NADH-dependent reductase (Old Yellow Enzyme family)
VGDSLLVGTVGGIKDGRTAQAMMDQGLDAIIVGRMFQKNPGLVFSMADELGVEVRMPNQIRWAFAGRGSK